MKSVKIDGKAKGNISEGVSSEGSFEVADINEDWVMVQPIIERAMKKSLGDVGMRFQVIQDSVDKLSARLDGFEKEQGDLRKHIYSMNKHLEHQVAMEEELRAVKTAYNRSTHDIEHLTLQLQEVQRNVQGLANIQLAAHTSTDDLELRVASLELECNIPEPVRGQATPEPKGPTGPSWAYSNMANLNFDEAAASAQVPDVLAPSITTMPARAGHDNADDRPGDVSIDVQFGLGTKVFSPARLVAGEASAQPDAVAAARAAAKAAGPAAALKAVAELASSVSVGAADAAVAAVSSSQITPNNAAGARASHPEGPGYRLDSSSLSEEEAKRMGMVQYNPVGAVQITPMLEGVARTESVTVSESGLVPGDLGSALDGASLELASGMASLVDAMEADPDRMGRDGELMPALPPTPETPLRTAHRDARPLSASRRLTTPPAGSRLYTPPSRSGGGGPGVTSFTGERMRTPRDVHGATIAPDDDSFESLSVALMNGEDGMPPTLMEGSTDAPTPNPSDSAKLDPMLALLVTDPAVAALPPLPASFEAISAAKKKERLVQRAAAVAAAAVDTITLPGMDYISQRTDGKAGGNADATDGARVFGPLGAEGEDGGGGCAEVGVVAGMKLTPLEREEAAEKERQLWWEMEMQANKHNAVPEAHKPESPRPSGGGKSRGTTSRTVPVLVIEGHQASPRKDAGGSGGKTGSILAKLGPADAWMGHPHK